jgi:hypothetical protein
MANKVFVFCPAFGQVVTATTYLTSLALQSHLLSKGIGGSFSTLSFPDIAELRNMVLTIWYDTMPDVDYLLFIDADMGFAPDLVIDMMLFGEPIVGTVYPQRKVPLSWAGSGTGAPLTERRGNFMHVEGVGFGCTLIRRDVPKIMLEQMPEIVDTRLNLHPAGETIKSTGAQRMIRAFEKLDIPDRGLISEDLSFCVRWNRCTMPDGSKGRVWAAIGHKLSHVGPFDYNGRYLDVVEAAQQVQAQQSLQGMPVGGPLSLPLMAAPAAMNPKPNGQDGAPIADPAVIAQWANHLQPAPVAVT